jgi:FkbM family methyltransferase
MKITYLDPYHFFNESIIPDDRPAVLVKVGIVGFTDLDKFRCIYPNSNIIAYEADPDNYSKSKNPEYPSPITRFINSAVGKSGSISLHRFTNCVSHSTFPRHTYDPNCVLKDTVVVRSVTLEEVFSENNLDYIDVLILNCEGGELDIMAYLNLERVRNRIGQICVSFHDPRIYQPIHRTKLITALGPYYYIKRGECPRGGIPDWLFIRKV